MIDGAGISWKMKLYLHGKSQEIIIDYDSGQNEYHHYLLIHNTMNKACIPVSNRTIVDGAVQLSAFSFDTIVDHARAVNNTLALPF